MGQLLCRWYLLLLAFCICFPRTATAATEVMCDPAFQDCRAMLLSRINSEPLAIDLAMLFMEDDGLADAIIARHNAGVRVRLLVEPRRNQTTPKNEEILARFSAAGIPMRAKAGGGVLHWKFMIFDAQNVLQWSAANYSDYYFKPIVPYANYTDEGIYFTDQPSLVDSFRRKFDDAWLDTAGFYNYANITGPLARRYPLYGNDPELSWVPFENFADRSVPLYDAEQLRIDSVMYKVTEPRHADGLIRARQRGVPVRLITEGERYRNPANFWQAYHIDRLYMAGVQIRDRAHEGFLHQKSTLLYGQGLTIFGSSNWTNESNYSQYEHNYFTNKTWFFEWFRDNFERKWTNRTGITETAAFRPLPPDVPAYVSPTAQANGVATSGVVLTWNPGPWSWFADIYFGTSPSPPLYRTDVGVAVGETNFFALPTLAPGTTYYWKIVSKTAAQQAATGQISSFTTASSTPPPPPPANAAPSLAITAPPPGSTFTAPATITISASAADSDGTVVRVDFLANGSLLGSDSSAPFAFSWTSVAAGNYSLTAHAVDDDGATASSASVGVSVTNPPVSLPAPWQSQDIGAVGPAGTASANSGTFTVSGGGADVWGNADAFHFASQRVSGDVDVIARVVFVEYVHAWVKAGVMIREKLMPDSAHAFMIVSPAKGRPFQRRVANGGVSTNTSSSGAAPAWVKLERRGNTIAAFVSEDGVAWTLVATDTFAMPTDVHVGLAVSSHDATRLATATFDNVTVRAVTAPPPPPPPPSLPEPWRASDVGAVGPAGTSTAASDTFTVRGGGADVWGTADAFQYVWQQITGDADVMARVATVEYVHAWVKAGVMIRETLDPGSAHAFMLVSAGKGYAFQRRIASSGLSTSTSGGAGTAPAWVKLERRASTISAFVSQDGARWTLVGSEAFTIAPTVYVGLAVSSHDVSRLATATFDNVRLQAVAAPPPPPAPPPTDLTEIVLHAADASVLAGAWQLAADSTAASGTRAWNPNAGGAKVVTAVAAPANFIELTFNAEAGRPYRLWIRGKAEGDAWDNDSAHVQFSGTIDAQGNAIYRIGTTSSAEFNLESCRGCGVAGWGWEDNGWGSGVLGPLLYFATTGPQRIRLQTREDGLSFDQIVLSASRFLNGAPGPEKFDATILPKSQ
jgi:regulation of enolase protein 1 (concanavalin A-like superfamily)